MSIYVKDSTVTFEWSIEPTASPLVKADYDIALTLPNGVTTYTDDGILTYLAPTATVQGKITYNLTPAVVGRYQVTLSVGTSAVHVIDATRDIYIVEPPTYVLNGITSSSLHGPGVLPEIKPTPPPVGFENVGEVLTTRATNYPGGVDIILKAGQGAAAVPASWTGYTGHANIAAALQASYTNPLDVGIRFPDMPDITKYGTPTVWDRTQNSQSDGGSPEIIAFDPLDEYNGTGWQSRAWGMFNFLNSATPETSRFITFGGEAGNWALFNGDNTEWDGQSWTAGDDVFIKLSNV